MHWGKYFVISKLDSLKEFDVIFGLITIALCKFFVRISLCAIIQTIWNIGCVSLTLTAFSITGVGVNETFAFVCPNMPVATGII